MLIHLLGRKFSTYFASSLRPANLLEKRLWHRYFPVNFKKFLRASFLQNTSGRLLLMIESQTSPESKARKLKLWNTQDPQWKIRSGREQKSVWIKWYFRLWFRSSSVTFGITSLYHSPNFEKCSRTSDNETSSC